MGIESYGITNAEEYHWSCNDCDEVIDLDHYNDIQAHIWAHADGSAKIKTMTRLQEALFNVLNDEFDLAQEPFFAMWRELEALLARNGMVAEPVTAPQKSWSDVTPQEILKAIQEFRDQAWTRAVRVDQQPIGQLTHAYTLRDLAQAYLAEVPIISIEPYKEPEYEYGAHLKGYSVHHESVWSTEQQARDWIRRATTLPDKWIACKRVRANEPGEWEDLP